MNAARITILSALFLSVAAQANAQSATLRYKAVSPAASYEFADTTISSMATAMGEMETNMYMTGGFQVGSEAAGDSLRVTSKLTAVVAGVSMMGQQMDAPMPDGWDAESTGMISVTGQNMASGMNAGASGGLVGEMIAQRLFLPLPAGAVQRGQSWTDSATVTMDSVMTGSVQAKSTGTWTGDTVVAGRTLHVLRYETEYAVKVAGESQGMQVSQEMKGSSVTIAHFDAQRGAMVEVRETGSMTGTTDVPAANMVGVASTTKLNRMSRIRQ